jgi:hypothetical protein
LSLAGAVAVCLGAGTAAQAVPASPNLGDFTIVEDIDVPFSRYIVTNNSPIVLGEGWYIYEFSVTHDPSSDGSSFTTKTGWDFAENCGNCDGTPTDPHVFSFFHATAAAVISSNDTVALAAILPQFIGPGGGTANEFFYSALAATGSIEYHFSLVDAAGNLAQVTNAVPLPATLPLMGSVLGGGWLISVWRRRKRRSTSTDAALSA